MGKSRRPESMITPEEAASALGISLSEVNAWIEKCQGFNPAVPVFVRIAGRVRQVAGKPMEQIGRIGASRPKP